MINGSIILLIVGAWAIYKLACWHHGRMNARATNHEVGR